jgi:hypothetical protein
MDHISILKRAWQILWSYKMLWVFGLILALTTTSGGGSGAGSSGSGGGGNNRTSIYEIQSIEELQFELDDLGEGVDALSNLITTVTLPQIASIVLALVVVLLCLALVIAVIVTILHYVSQTALIRLVDDYESTGEKRGFRDGFRMGWSRSAFRLFLIKLIITIPTVVVFIVLYVIAAIPLALWATDNTTAGVIGTAISVGLFLLITFTLIALVIVLTLLVKFFWRACALEGLGVIDSIRRGWYVVRHSPSDVVIMWLIMAGISIGWAIFILFTMVLLLPVFILLLVIGVLLGAIPGLLVFGLASLIFEGVLPIILAVMVGLPIFILVIVSPIVFLSALMEVFKSSVWTLTYRQLVQMESADPEPIPLEPEQLPEELEQFEEPELLEGAPPEPSPPDVE